METLNKKMILLLVTGQIETLCDNKLCNTLTFDKGKQKTISPPAKIRSVTEPCQGPCRNPLRLLYLAVIRNSKNILSEMDKYRGG